MSLVNSWQMFAEEGIVEFSLKGNRGTFGAYLPGIVDGRFIDIAERLNEWILDMKDAARTVGRWYVKPTAKFFQGDVRLAGCLQQPITFNGIHGRIFRGLCQI